MSSSLYSKTRPKATADSSPTLIEREFKTTSPEARNYNKQDAYASLRRPQVLEKDSNMYHYRGEDKVHVLLEEQRKALENLEKTLQLSGISFILSAPTPSAPDRQESLANRELDTQFPVRATLAGQNTRSQRSLKRNLTQIFRRSLLRAFFFALMRAISRHVKSSPGGRGSKRQVLSLLYCYAISIEIAAMIGRGLADVEDEGDVLEFYRQPDRHTFKLPGLVDTLGIFSRDYMLFWERCENFEYNFRALIDRMTCWLSLPVQPTPSIHLILAQDAMRTLYSGVDNLASEVAMESDQCRNRSPRQNSMEHQPASSRIIEGHQNGRLWGRVRRANWKGSKKGRSSMTEVYDWAWHHLYSGHLSCCNFDEKSRICSEKLSWQNKDDEEQPDEEQPDKERLDDEILDGERLDEELSELSVSCPVKIGSLKFWQASRSELLNYVQERDGIPWLCMLMKGTWSKYRDTWYNKRYFFELWAEYASVHWLNYQKLASHRDTCLASSFASDDSTSPPDRSIRSYDTSAPCHCASGVYRPARFDALSNGLWVLFEVGIVKDFRPGRNGTGANKSWKHQKILLSDKHGKSTAKLTSATPDFNPSSSHSWRREKMLLAGGYKSKTLAPSSLQIMPKRGTSSLTATKQRLKRQARQSMKKETYHHDNDDLRWDDSERIEYDEDDEDEEWKQVEHDRKWEQVEMLTEVKEKNVVLASEDPISATIRNQVTTEPSPVSGGTTIVASGANSTPLNVVSQPEVTSELALKPVDFGLSNGTESTSIVSTETSTLIPGPAVNSQSKRAKRRQLLAEKHGLKEWKEFPKTEEQKQRKREANNRHQRNQRKGRAAKKALASINQESGEI